MIVATDEEFERRLAENDFFINRKDLTDYEGGYVDGKIIDRAYLEDVAARANDPTRAAFEGVFLAYSHVPGMEELIRSIPVYPEAEHAERIRKFYSAAFIGNWLVNEADRHGNVYALNRGATQLALYSGRLLLAHNRKLYPFHKWLPKTLELVPEKPDGLMPAFDALLREPSSARAKEYFEMVRDFHDWGVTDLEAYTWFMSDVEWSWRNGTTPLEDI